MVNAPIDQADLPRSRKAEQTRERLLDAAAAVVADRGYERATLAEIASAAGYTIGALQGHFRTKLDLVTEASRRALAETLPPRTGEFPVTKQVEKAADPTEALLRRLNLEICVAAKDNPELASLMCDVVEERAVRLLDRIEAGVEDGTIRRRSRQRDTGGRRSRNVRRPGLP